MPNILFKLKFYVNTLITSANLSEILKEAKNQPEVKNIYCP